VPEVILTLWLVLFAYLIEKEARRESTIIQ
jgi:hypothetical protein